MTPKKIVIIVIIFLALLITPFVIKSSLLKGESTLTLNKSSTFAGIISQSLGVNGSSQNLPVEGKDYKLNTIFFDNKTWAIATIIPLKSNADTSTVVINNQNPGNPRIVLGPGSVFSSNGLSNIPADITSYLKSEGLIYVPAPE